VVGWAASRLDFRKFDFRSVGPIGLIRLDLFHFPLAFLWVRFFESHCPGRMVGWGASRLDFRKFDFRFVGSIALIPIDLFHFPGAFFWVRFFGSHCPGNMVGWGHLATRFSQIRFLLRSRYRFHYQRLNSFLVFFFLGSFSLRGQRNRCGGQDFQ